MGLAQLFLTTACWAEAPVATRAAPMMAAENFMFAVWVGLVRMDGCLDAGNSG